jgi:small subunit ribosomal protein S6
VNNYEVMYIVKPVEEDAYNTVVKKFDDLLVANGATIEKTDKWGKNVWHILSRTSTMVCMY